MAHRSFVLVITLRPAKLCATQAVLHRQGIELLTVTSFTGGRAAIQRLGVDAVIVCRHSWSAVERDVLFRELMAIRPPLKFVMRCPGCTDCDETAGMPGVLTDAKPLEELVSTVVLGRPETCPSN